jgi:beta-lactamase class A
MRPPETVTTQPQTSASPANRVSDLQAELDAICEQRPFKTSFYVKDLRTGYVAHRSGTEPTPSASTRKIMFMMAAFRAVAEGRLDLNEPVVAEPRFMQGIPSGTFYYMTPGLTFPLRDAILQMIITSDNICTSILGERISVEEFNDFCLIAGMKGTVINHVVPPRDLPMTSDFDFVASTTPNDQGHLLEQILEGAKNAQAAARLGCTQDLCNMALEFLSWQAFRTMIPALLPGNTKVANKTGTGRHGKMDAGVVYCDNVPSFVIAAYTHHVPQQLPNGMPGHSAAMDTIARLSRASWDVLVGQYEEPRHS